MWPSPLKLQFQIEAKHLTLLRKDVLRWDLYSWRIEWNIKRKEKYRVFRVCLISNWTSLEILVQLRACVNKCQIPGGEGRFSKYIYTKKYFYCAKRKLIKSQMSADRCRLVANTKNNFSMERALNQFPKINGDQARYFLLIKFIRPIQDYNVWPHDRWATYHFAPLRLWLLILFEYIIFQECFVSG